MLFIVLVNGQWSMEMSNKFIDYFFLFNTQYSLFYCFSNVSTISTTKVFPLSVVVAPYRNISVFPVLETIVRLFGSLLLIGFDAYLVSSGILFFMGCNFI